MPRGFLTVTSHPSALLPESEFHDWYEGEHIPLRLDRLREFLSGARYRAVDGGVSSDAEPSSIADSSSSLGAPTHHPATPPYGPARPEWLAMYEIDDTGTFSKPAYTSLRVQRSAREASVMERLGVLVRLTGEDVGVWSVEASGKVGAERSTISTGMKPGNPSGWVITHGLRVQGDKEAKKWAEGAVQVIKDREGEGEVRGWVRTRLVRVLESGETRLGTPYSEGGGVMPYFVVHECVDEGSMRALKGVVSGSQQASARFGEDQQSIEGQEGQEEIGEWREWTQYKAYPCVSHSAAV